MLFWNSKITLEELYRYRFVDSGLATYESEDKRFSKTLCAMIDTVERTVTYEIELTTVLAPDMNPPIKKEFFKYASLTDAIDAFNKIVFPKQGELTFEGWKEPIQSPGVNIFEID
jgi:hypothetical protein